MKALSLAILVTLTFLNCGANGLQAAEGLYKTIFVKGVVSFTREGNKRSILKGDILIEGDIVETSNKGIVLLGFGQGFRSKIKLTKNAHFKILPAKMIKEEGQTKRLKSYYLKLGNAVIDWVNKDKKKNRLRIETKTAAMGVRGTRFFTHVQLDNKVVSAVYEGLVMGKHKTDNGVGIALGPGKGAVFLPNGTSREVKNPKWFKDINWKLSGEDADALRHGNNLLKSFRKEFTSYKRPKRPGYLSGSRKKSGALKLSDAEKKLKDDCLNKKIRTTCTVLAFKLLKNSVSGDHPIIRNLFRSGCNLGDGKACVWTGRVEYELGDKEVGKKVVNDQCDAGNSYGCYTMWELAKIDGDPDADKYYKKSVELLHNIKDVNKSLAEFQVACDLDNPGACYNIGVLLDNLNRKSEAKGYYKKACDKEDGEACSNLGFYFQEDGNAEEARKLYQKACFKSIPEGCYNLACIHSTRGKKDLAISYLKMAVSNGYLDYAHAKQDSDLKNVRSHADYGIIMTMMEGK